MGLQPCAFQPKRTKSRPSSPRRFWGILGWTRTEIDNKSRYRTRFLLVFSSDVAGWIAPGSAVLLESCGPSGRAARLEPNERVHERRAELCGDGAWWRPPGPVHSLKPNGFSRFVPNVATHGCHPHPQPPSSPPRPGQLGLPAWAATSWPPFVREQLFPPELYAVQDPPPKWASEVRQFPPPEIFDIMQESRCNWNNMEAALTPPNRRTQKCTARRYQRQLNMWNLSGSHAGLVLMASPTTRTVFALFLHSSD